MLSLISLLQMLKRSQLSASNIYMIIIGCKTGKVVCFSFNILLAVDKKSSSVSIYTEHHFRVGWLVLAQRLIWGHFFNRYTFAIAGCYLNNVALRFFGLMLLNAT